MVKTKVRGTTNKQHQKESATNPIPSKARKSNSEYFNIATEQFHDMLTNILDSCQL